jgi:hypothetical protein
MCRIFNELGILIAQTKAAPHMFPATKKDTEFPQMYNKENRDWKNMTCTNNGDWTHGLYMEKNHANSSCMFSPSLTSPSRVTATEFKYNTIL